MSVYNKIDKILRERNMSRRQLALKIGVPPSTLASSFSRQAGMSAQTLIKIASALDKNVEDFFDDESDLKETQALIPTDKKHVHVAEDAMTKEKAEILESSISLPPFLNHFEIERAKEDADSTFLASVEQISDTYLRSELLNKFKLLNRLGKFTAVEWLGYMVEIPRFQKIKDR
jgi:transcriptional regulator with XRE-family HTH domain